MYRLKRLPLNQNDISFLDQQVSFPTLLIATDSHCYVGGIFYGDT